MKFNRTKNTVWGTVWGALERTANIVMPFVIRTILIHRLGSEYAGLQSLFKSILSVLNLTELGFGAAAIFAMYKPIAEDDYRTVGAIFTYLKKVYRVIGAAVLGLGLLAVPFLDVLIDGEPPADISIVILYGIYLFNTAISYLLFAHKTSLLTALQNNAAVNRVDFLCKIGLYTLQIVLLTVHPNYYVYSVLIPVSTIIANIVRSSIVDKRYAKWTQPEVLDRALRQDIRSRLFPLMATKVAGVLIGTADTLVVSAFLGLNAVTLYHNYYDIVHALILLMEVLYKSMQSGIGNALVSDGRGKIMSDFRRFHFMNNWMVTVCAACLICMYQPFMRIWLGENMLLPIGIVILFTVYFYCYSIPRIVNIYKDAAGIWREDMLRCYLCAALNLLVNIVTVRYIGLYGVIGSSIAALLVEVSVIPIILYRNVFKEKAGTFILRELMDALVALLICAVSYFICSFIPEGFLGLIARGIICVLVADGLLLLFFGRTEEYRNMKEWIGTKIKHWVRKTGAKS